MTSDKSDKARALRELLGVEVKFEKLSKGDLDILFALMGDPATLAERIASGIAKDRVRGMFKDFSTSWRPGMFIDMLSKK